MFSPCSCSQQESCFNYLNTTQKVNQQTHSLIAFFTSLAVCRDLADVLASYICFIYMGIVDGQKLSKCIC